MAGDSPARLIITGGSGFVGRALLQALADMSAGAVTVLTRNPAPLRLASGWNNGWQATDLSEALTRPEGVDWGDAAVLHLAAATGRASPRDHHRVNVELTERIMRFAALGGARHFVYVSSIAAAYRDRRWYPYAESKVQAERRVAGGSLPFTIVRPTMVFGPGSPVQAGLARLAGLPRPVLFGDGQVRTQPVDVRDVAAVLAGLSREQGRGEVLELGGRDVLPLEALYARLRAAMGKNPATPLRIPAGPTRQVLALAEVLLRPLLPLTAGQLAAFVNDSSAAPSPTVHRLLAVPRGLAEMLSPAGRA